MIERTQRERKRKRGFTLIELLVAIAIIALLIGILLPAPGGAGRTGELAVCAATMKQLGVATGTYVGDYQDRIFSFMWRAGETSLMADESGDLVPTRCRIRTTSRRARVRPLTSCVVGRIVSVSTRCRPSTARARTCVHVPRDPGRPGPAAPPEDGGLP